MSPLIQESNQLIEQLDFFGDLLTTNDESSDSNNLVDHSPLNDYLASVKRTIDKFQHRATELSNDCVENQVAIKKGLGRITYWLFTLGFTMAVIVNILLVTINASLPQLAICNFGTTIVFVLAGICLLNDFAKRDQSNGSQRMEIHHKIRSIKGNVDQLSRLTFDWNKQLHDLDLTKAELESSVQRLESQEQELSSRIEIKERELQQIQDEKSSRYNESVEIKAEFNQLQSLMVEALRDMETTLADKSSAELQLNALKNSIEVTQAELTNCEKNLFIKQQEIDEVEAYSLQVQSEIVGVQKQIAEFEIIEKELAEGINEKNRVVESTQKAIESLVGEERSIKEKISEVQCRLDALCESEARNNDLIAIQASIELSRQQFEDLQSSRTSLEDAILELTSMRNELSSETDVLRLNFQEQSMLVDHKSQHLDSLANHEMLIQAQIDEANGRLAALQSQEIEQLELAECNADLVTKRDEISALQNQTDSLRDETHLLALEASELQSMIRALNEELETDLQTHIQTIEETKSNIESLNALEIATREKLRVTELDLTSIRIENQVAQDATAEIQKHIEDAQVKLAELEAEYVRKQGQSILLENQLDLKLGQLDKIEALIEETKTRELTLSTLCQDAEGRIAVLADKSECLAEHLAKMTEGLENLERQKQQSDEALMQANSLLSEKSRQIDSLEAEIADRETKLEEVQHEYATQDQLHAAKLHDLSQLETKIRESETALDELHAAELQCDTARQERSVLQRDIEQLTLQKEEAINECKRIQGAIQLGRNKLDENEKALQQSINEVVAAEMKSAKASESQCLLMAESHQLSIAINASKTKIASLQSEIESLSRERQELKDQSHRLQQECDEIASCNESLDAIQKDLQLRIGTDRLELAACATDLNRAANLQQEVQALESQIDLMNRDSQAISLKVATLERECQSGEYERDALASELKRFEDSIAKTERTFGDLNQKCEMTKLHLADFESRKVSVRKELDQLEQNSTKSKLAVDLVQKELALIEKNRNQAQIDLERYSAEVIESQAVCQQWQEYGEMLKRTNLELDASQKTLQRQVQSLQVEQKNTEYALQQNVLAVKNAASQRDKLLTEIQGLESKQGDLVRSEDAIKHSLESKRTLLNELDTELDRSRMNVDATILEFEQLRLKCKTEKALLAELVAQHDELLREISNRSQLYEQQTRRCDDLKSQEQSLVMKLAQMKDKIQVFQDQEKLFSEKQAQWETIDATYTKKSIELENLQHGLTMNREQLKAVTKELNDCQRELGTNRDALENVLGKLNQSKLQFTRETGLQEALLANLSSDVQAKQIDLQTTKNALQIANEKLARADEQLTSLSAQLSESEIKFASTESQMVAAQQENQLTQASIAMLKVDCDQLEYKRDELLAAIDVIEKQREMATAESFTCIQAHLELKAKEASLAESCKLLEGELQSKQELLSEAVLQIGAREQQLVETLQAITLIGQQRELAVARLESDREAIEQAKNELDTLQTQQLECESSVLQFNSEVARLLAGRDQLNEELRLLESQRQVSQVEVVQTHTAIESMNCRDSDAFAAEIAMDAEVEVKRAPTVISDEDSLEVEILSELREVVQAIEEKTPKDDIWGDLLRVVRTA